MDYQEVIALIKIERECVNRNNQPFGMNCDRECGKCDLLQNADDLIEMYNDILEWLEELKELRSTVRCNAFKDGYNKAIDDFVNRIDSVEYIPICTDCLSKRQIKDIAEQLKESERTKEFESCEKCKHRYKSDCEYPCSERLPEVPEGTDDDEMSDEDLAEYFSKLIKDTYENEYCKDVNDWLKWLQLEVEE